MIVFLLVFITLYGGMHAYLFFKARAALEFGLTTGLGLALFMLLMILAPILVHILERQNWESAARSLAYVGYIWMALLFLFFSSSLLLDVHRLLLHLLALLSQKDFSNFSPAASVRFFAPALVAALATIYGLFEAGSIRVEKLTIRTPEIPAEVGSLRIAQISDLHLGLIVRQTRLEKILNLVEQAHPDILVSTGDLVDGEICHDEAVVELLQAVNPRFGKYAVTGNHEFYAGLDRALKRTEKAGFRVLRGERIDVAGVLSIAGVDDPEARSFRREAGLSEKQLLSQDAEPAPDLSGRKQRKFTILLKHRPVADSSALGLFDLQLSGHTHKGQIYPFTLLSLLFYPFDAGFFPLAKGSRLYVSRGSGTWGPPIRFLAPPEVTMIELMHAEL